MSKKIILNAEEKAIILASVTFVTIMTKNSDSEMKLLFKLKQAWL